MFNRTAPPRSRPGSADWYATAGIVAFIAAAKLLVHLYAAGSYGYFIDELYYLACARHLDWGYVDQPPLIAFIGRLALSLGGESLHSIRLLPALAGVCKVLLTGWMARELGGGRFAQGLAALCILVAPGFLAIDNWLSMNAFEPVFWMGCTLAAMRLIKTGDEKLWLWIGVLAGIGLENKHSMLIWSFALITGLLLTPERRLLRSRWFWIACAIALALWGPNLAWNIQHHFPFLEIQANIRAEGRNVSLSPAAFLGEEVLSMLPLSAPVWIGGLAFLLLSQSARRFRALGWAWLIAAAVVVLLNPRIYYLFPAFPLLFAAGSVFWESYLARPALQRGMWRWIKPVWVALIAAMGMVLAPLAIPLLPVPTYLRYVALTHLEQPRIENRGLGPLPQLFADQFGWEEMTAAVAGAFHKLPPEVQSKTAIFAQFYGQAGAIDLFGPKYGLPPAISGHQNYFLWGPRGYTGESMIVLADRQERLEQLFVQVEKVAQVYHPYSMPDQHFDVFYCQGMKVPLGEIWPRMKKWQ